MVKVAVALPLIEPLIGNSASSGNPDFGVKMMAAPYREGKEVWVTDSSQERLLAVSGQGLATTFCPSAP